MMFSHHLRRGVIVSATLYLHADLSRSHCEFGRNSIADAAAIVMPSVVNIVTHDKGMLVNTARAGSGFIISEVTE